MKVGVRHSERYELKGKHYVSLLALMKYNNNLMAKSRIVVGNLRLRSVDVGARLVFRCNENDNSGDIASLPLVKAPKTIDMHTVSCTLSIENKYDRESSI